MLRSKLYGHLDNDDSTPTMGSSNHSNDKAADASHLVNSVDRPRPSLLDEKIAASMRSVRQMQSMRQVTPEGNGVAATPARAERNGVGATPARVETRRNLGTTARAESNRNLVTPTRAESNRNLGEKPTTGRRSSKSSSRPMLNKRYQSTREMTTGTDVFNEGKQEQKSATATQKRPGLKGHRAQSSRLAVYQNKSASRSSGRPKRKMDTTAKASPETDFNLSGEAAKDRPALASAKTVARRSRRSSLSDTSPRVSLETDSNLSGETAKARPDPAAARRSRRSSLTMGKTDMSTMPVTPEKMDFADFADFSWKRENSKEQTTAESKVPEENQEMNFADFPQEMDFAEFADSSWKRENPKEETTAKSKVPEEDQEGEFADFAKENPKEETTAESKVPEENQEMDSADVAKQKKRGKSCRLKVDTEMDFTWKREPAQKSGTNDAALSPVREKSSRRSSQTRLMQKSPSERKQSYARDLLHSPSERRRSQPRDVLKASPTARRLSDERNAQAPSQRRSSQSKGGFMSPSARRSLGSQSRDEFMSPRARRSSLVLRANLPASPETETAAVATSEHANKQGIGEIAKLLQRSKQVHAENQQLEEEKRGARLTKIRARRRAKQAPASPDHTVATHWERAPPMGLQAIPTI